MRPLILAALIAIALFAASTRPVSSPSGADRGAADLPPISLRAGQDGYRAPGWDIKVGADGNAVVNIWGFSGRTQRRIRVSPAEFATLNRALNENHFFALASDYGSDYADGCEETLTIRRGDDVKSVVLHNLQNVDSHSPDIPPDTQQAIAVWETVRDWTNHDPDLTCPHP